MSPRLPQGITLVAVALGCVGAARRSPLADLCTKGEVFTHMTFSPTQVDTLQPDLRAVLGQSYVQDVEFAGAPGPDCEERGGSVLSYGALPPALGGTVGRTLKPDGQLAVIDKAGAAQGVWGVLGPDVVATFPLGDGRLLTLIVSRAAATGSWQLSRNGQTDAQGGVTTQKAEP